MQTIEYRTIDKSAWGEGPWQDEPDKVQWQDDETGLPCLAVRHREGGHLCGYVGVPSSHRLHGKSYNDVNFDVHGGLTFASGCSHGPENVGVCHKLDAGEPDDVWWFGFDCAHLGDRSPGWERHRGYDPDDRYRTLDYVKSQCRSLARELAAVTTGETP